MTQYRVGEAGATVFDAEGKPVVRLQPGCVVVEGTIDTVRLPSQDDPKRRKGYADKRQRVAEDKTVGWGSTSSRVPDGYPPDEISR